MGLIGNNYDAAVRANNKYLMREAFMKGNVPCPKYIMLSNSNMSSDDKMNAIKNFELPLIVKPSDRSGSLGVYKITEPSEFSSAVDNAMSVSFKKQVMVEEFIEGREISVEFISYNGVHYPLQITDKVTTDAPHFVELEHHQPSTLTKEQYATIYDITTRALNSLGLTNGASHSEYKITKDGRICIMEIGGRMGGDFIGSALVRLSAGYDFVKGVIDVALGNFEKPVITEHNYAGVYFLCKGTEKVKMFIENKEKYPFIVQSEITDCTLREVTCSSERSGYFIYQSDKKITLE
jgi:biotin carboxylase